MNQFEKYPFIIPIFQGGGNSFLDSNLNQSLNSFDSLGAQTTTNNVVDFNSLINGEEHKRGLFARKRFNDINAVDNKVLAEKGFVNPNMNFEPSIGFESNVDNMGIGRNPNYVNGLSEDSLTAGEDFQANNPLPEGVFADSIDFTPKYNYNEPSGQVGSNPNVRYRDTYFNPYGGVNLESALFKLGQSFRNEGSTGNTLMGIGAAGKVLLNSGRLIGAGMGVANREAEVNKYYREQQRRALANANQYSNGGLFQYFKNGGTVTDLTPEMALTGEYITGLPEHALDKANAEIEKNEYVKHPNGDVQKVVGKTHEQGGEKVNLEVGTKIISDNLKVDGDLASEIKKEYGIEVSTKDTYARVVEKYTNKLGITKLVEEQEALFKRLKKQEEIKDDSTSRLNNEFLSGKIKEIEDEKKELEKQRASFVEFVFGKQESKKEAELPTFREGGVIKDRNLINLMKKYNIDEETALNLIDNFKKGGMKETSYYQEGGMKLSEAAKKHLDNPNIKSEAYLLGALKAASNYDKDEAYRVKAKADYEAMVEARNYLVQQEKLKEKARVANIEKLKKSDSWLDNIEGYGRDLLGFQNGGVKDLQEWINQQSYKAEYELGDVEQTAARFKDLADNANVKYTDEDFKDMNSLNRLAGRIQQQIIKDKPSLAYDYGLTVNPTRQGLQYLVDNKLINPEELGIELVQGKVKRGSYDTLSDDSLNKIQSTLEGLKPEQKQKYALTNYNDNLAFFRGIKTKEQNLSPEEYKQFTEVNKDKLLDNGYYKTEVEGVYVKPSTGEVVDTTKPASTDVINPLDPNANIKGINLAEIRNRLNIALLPDQSALPPDAVQPHTKISRRYERLDPVKIGVEENMKEIFRQEDFATNALNEIPDSQRRAALANLTSSSQENINKAITSANIANAQNFQQTEQFNIGQSNKEEDTRAVDMLDFERRQLTALGKTQADIANYFDYNRKIQLGNFNTVNRLNVLNDIYENYNFNPMGGIDFDTSASVPFYAPDLVSTVTEDIKNKKK